MVALKLDPVNIYTNKIKRGKSDDDIIQVK